MTEPDTTPQADPDGAKTDDGTDDQVLKDAPTTEGTTTPDVKADDQKPAETDDSKPDADGATDGDPVREGDDRVVRVGLSAH